MKGIMRSLYVVIFLGIAAGSFCIAGFIYTASMLSFFAKELKKKKNTLDKSFIGIPSPDVQPAVTGDQATSNTTQKEVDVQKLMFGKLTGIFQTYFMLAAMILSATVLCAGALFSTINSLDFIKLLTDDWGYSPARSDFVYFYGALFTIVLLFVYVPAKIKFAEVDVWSKDPTAATAPAGKWYDIVKNPFDSFKGVLVAASPLLASLLQSLLDLLFNKAG